MKPNVTLYDFKEIIALFEEDGKAPVHARIDMGRLFIEGKDNELMLRLNHYTKRLVIARIKFRHGRKGYGGKLLEILKLYGQSNGYEMISIESVSTQEAVSFALKHGFYKERLPFLIEDEETDLFCNYHLNI